LPHGIGIFKLFFMPGVGKSLNRPYRKEVRRFFCGVFGGGVENFQALNIRYEPIIFGIKKEV